MAKRVLVSDPLSQQGIEVLEQAGLDVDVKTGLCEDELAAIIGEYEGLVIRSQTQVTARVIAAAKKLKVIGRAGVGVDNVDLEAATEHGIVVLNAPSGNTISTAEHTMAMLLALARNIPQAHLSMQEGRWERKKYTGVELNNKVLGIIGLGRVGSEVAVRAHAFGMKILAYDPYLAEERAEELGIRLANIDEIRETSDFITVHTPLTPKTRNLIGKAEFARMKDQVRIVNCARGGIIDYEALAQAVKEGKLLVPPLTSTNRSPRIFRCGPAPGDLNPHLALPLKRPKSMWPLMWQGTCAGLRQNLQECCEYDSTSRRALSQLEPISPQQKLGSMAAQLSRGGIAGGGNLQGELAELEIAPLTTALLQGPEPALRRGSEHGQCWLPAKNAASR